LNVQHLKSDIVRNGPEERQKFTINVGGDEGEEPFLPLAVNAFTRSAWSLS